MQLAVFITVLSALVAPSFQNSAPSFVASVLTNFVERMQSKGVYENTTRNTILGYIECTDADGDPVSYFVENSISLVISATNGSVILSNRLDKEASNNVASGTQGKGGPNTATLGCRDHPFDGSDSKSISVDIVINVNDNNDEVPEFVNLTASHTFYILEDAPIGTSLDIISIVDKDRGVNARLDSLTYVCEAVDPGPCETFNLTYREITEGQYEAQFVLRSPLDYETRVDYRAKLVAVDGNGIGIGPNDHNTASTGIQIKIVDTQDTPPVFSGPTGFDITEETPVGTVLNFRVSARDGDRDGKHNISFEILRDPTINLFRLGDSVRLDPTSTVYSAPLIVNERIDRDGLAGTFYVFIVKATEVDNGTLTNATSTARYSVAIRDLNDNNPEFSKPDYLVVVNEIPYQIGFVTIPNLRIEVNDPDEPLNARYTLQIVNQTFRGAFGFAPNIEVTGSQVFALTVIDFYYMDYDIPANRRQTIKLATVPSGQQTGVDTTTITVLLKDVNDNEPQFNETVYATSVREDAQNFTSLLTVYAADKDSGDNGKLRYSIDQTFSDLFYIDPVGGTIYLIGQLDYEAVNEYAFTVSAADQSSKPKTSQALVRIAVNNYNDVGPQFSQDAYTGRVTETSTEFESPVQVQAFDPQDSSANITYRIVSGNTPTNSFYLHPFTGVLTLLETVNYEQTPNRTGLFILKIEASDNEEPPVTAVSQITISVVDENNHSPIFNPTRYNTTVSEAVSAGIFLLRVTATDLDFGSNGVIFYRIGGGGKDNIVVSPDGNVSVSNFPNFDYEEYQSLTVQINAFDGGSPQRSAAATLLVTVTDANDESPTFRQNLYAATVDEASAIGTPVLTVSATDVDTNYDLRYSIPVESILAIKRGGSLLDSVVPYDYTKAFRVDPFTGVVSVGSVLDRTYVVEMSFDVKVEDVHPTAIGTQTDTTRITLTIQGQPETELYFIRPWTKAIPGYTVPILESHSVGQDIWDLEARDPVDQSIVSIYEEVDGTDDGDYFRVITKTDSIGVTRGAVILNRPLDYDEAGHRFLGVQVQARKPATPQLATRTVLANITVQVQDYNDNPPDFTRSIYNFTVQENVPENFELGIITAIDRDSSTFGPVEIRLGLAVGGEDFKIYQSNVGGGAKLLVKNSPDYEETRRYTLTVLAIDSSSVSESSIRLTSTALVNIEVLDLNDNDPEFSTQQGRVFSVEETANPQRRIGVILASDKDNGINGAFSYFLLDDPAFNTGASGLPLFAITPESGALFTKESLNGRSGAYKMLVMVRDRGSPSRSSTLAITIKVQPAEDDDGTPQFQQPINNYVVRVTEHNQTRLDVHFVANARTPNASVEFSLVPFSTDYMNFNIDQNGYVYVTADLDYEIKTTYTLVVQAQDTVDNSLIKRRTLIVELIDIDDNDPSFKKSIYDSCPNDFEVPTEFSVQDKTPVGIIVAQASACDPDGPANNQITYMIYTGNDLCRDNNFNNFDVLANGSIVTRNQMNYEERTEHLVCVTVMLRNQGRKKRDIDTADMVNTDLIGYILITVIDINDNGPSFIKYPKVAVLETLPIENTILQISAIDPDGPLNNRVRYAISDTMYYPSDNGLPFSMRAAFSINPENGIISTNLPSYSDFAYGYFILNLTAFDMKNQLFNDSRTLQVVVYKKTQTLRVTLNKDPVEGVQVSRDLIRALNISGQPDKEFFFKSASEHRTVSSIDTSRTDVCFVIVENNQGMEAYKGVGVLNEERFQNVLRGENYSFVSTGTCYPLKASQEDVKWRDLWWVLVVIAVFIFVCVLILIATVSILYNRYKNYMDTQTTYLVPQ